MLHVWLVPALAVIAGAVCVFYLTIRITGGTGVRTEGRTIVDKQVEEDHPLSTETRKQPAHSR